MQFQHPRRNVQGRGRNLAPNQIQAIDKKCDIYPSTSCITSSSLSGVRNESRWLKPSVFAPQLPSGFLLRQTTWRIGVKILKITYWYVPTQHMCKTAQYWSVPLTCVPLSMTVGRMEASRMANSSADRSCHRRISMLRLRVAQLRAAAERSSAWWFSSVASARARIWGKRRANMYAGGGLSLSVAWHLLRKTTRMDQEQTR